jgi:hypothetical protein
MIPLVFTMRKWTPLTGLCVVLCVAHAASASTNTAVSAFTNPIAHLPELAARSQTISGNASPRPAGCIERSEMHLVALNAIVRDNRDFKTKAA